MEQKNKGGNAIGISLILVVFILLCLITFGTLSYLLAKVDNDLSISATDNIIAFYDADLQAQATLAAIDTVLAQHYARADSLADYAAALQSHYKADDTVSITQSDDVLLLTFETEVSDKEVLVATLALPYPAQDTYYTIQAWVLESLPQT